MTERKKISTLPPEIKLSPENLDFKKFVEIINDEFRGKSYECKEGELPSFYLNLTDESTILFRFRYEVQGKITINGRPGIGEVTMYCDGRFFLRSETITYKEGKQKYSKDLFFQDHDFSDDTVVVRHQTRTGRNEWFKFEEKDIILTPPNVVTLRK